MNSQLRLGKFKVNFDKHAERRTVSIRYLCVCLDAVVPKKRIALVRSSRTKTTQPLHFPCKHHPETTMHCALLRVCIAVSFSTPCISCLRGRTVAGINRALRLSQHSQSLADSSCTERSAIRSEPQNVHSANRNNRMPVNWFLADACPQPHRHLRHNTEIV